MKERIEKLKEKLRMAEQNYKETRADAYLIEQHQLKEKIASLEREEREPATVSDEEDGTTDQQERGVWKFQPPINIEELPSAITRHLLIVEGDKVRDWDDKTVAVKQREILEESRAFYEEQNDTDALVRLQSMIDKTTAIIDGESEDGTEEGPADDEEGTDGNTDEGTGEEKPTEATETAPAAPQKPKPSKSTNGGKKSSSKGKSKGGSKKK